VALRASRPPQDPAAVRESDLFSRAWSRQKRLWETRAGRVAILLLAALFLLTAIGLALLWPAGRPHFRGAVNASATQSATIVAVFPRTCPVETHPGCKQVNLRLTSGPARGTLTFLMMPGDEAVPTVNAGDHISVLRNDESLLGPGVVPRPDQQLDPAQAPYGFVDFQRQGPILFLAIAFAVLVLILGRRAGLLSLLGLGIGLLLVTQFVIPSIVAGHSPFTVGLVGSFAVLFATIVLTYGIGPKSLAALLGTAASLLLTALLALIFVHRAHLTGTSTDEATLLQSLLQTRPGGFSLQGLTLAAIVIAALGVLNDVTVSQASTVIALQRVNPAQRAHELFTGAMRVGRDHLSATVNTLAFAYAGAALPLLLLFYTQDASLATTINREAVATELVAMLVGSIGLVAAVPLTTSLAALLVSHLPADTLPEVATGHAH
jgi:uncharacterized membrane protein